MRKYKRAIVKPPNNNYVYAISTQPDKDTISVQKALKQHLNFIEVLKNCGLEVIVFPQDEYPDSCFIEDTVVIINNKAIICRPKPLSRREEANEVEKLLPGLVSEIYRIKDPGIIEGGNIIITEREIFIGNGERTNPEGIEQFKRYINEYKVSSVEHFEAIHLKTFCTYIGNDTFVLDPRKIDKNIFRHYRIIEVDEDESCGANCIGFNGHVLIPDGCSKTAEKIQKLGFKVYAVDISEFRKGDGSITCLAVLF